MFHGGSSLRKFSKIKKSFKIPNMPKIVPKSVQTCFEDVLGLFFRKNFLPNVPWWVESSKIFKNKKKFQNSKHAQNRSQKCPNVFWRCFRVIFSKKNFCPVFHGGSSLRKFSKKSKKFPNSKNARNRSKKCPNVFWTSLGVIFSKKFFVQCSMEGRVSENFRRNQKSFKIPKMPKIVPKSVQTCFEDVLGWFFRKNFLPNVPWWVESSKIFKNKKKFQNSKNARNRSQKCPNVFWRCFRVIFSKKLFAQCSMVGRVFENFQK